MELFDEFIFKAIKYKAPISARFITKKVNTTRSQWETVVGVVNLERIYSLFQNCRDNREKKLINKFLRLATKTNKMAK